MAFSGYSMLKCFNMEVYKGCICEEFSAQGFFIADQSSTAWVMEFIDTDIL